MDTTLALILIFVGLLLAIPGILYLTKPDLYKQGFLKSIDFSGKFNTPVKTYGWALTILGVILFAIGMFA
jgi:hypothetical protein